MKDLTDEQLNIAICEWRGWKRRHRYSWENRGKLDDARKEGK